MEKETKIVLLTHGGWGEALVGSLGMILGSIDCVHEIALKPSYTLPEYMGMVRSTWTPFPRTPSSSPTSLAAPLQRCRCHRKPDGRKGLLRPQRAHAPPRRASSCRTTAKLDYDAILSAGKAACKDVVAEVKANMAEGR